MKYASITLSILTFVLALIGFLYEVSNGSIEEISLLINSKVFIFELLFFAILFLIVYHILKRYNPKYLIISSIIGLLFSFYQAPREYLKLFKSYSNKIIRADDLNKQYLIAEFSIADKNFDAEKAQIISNQFYSRFPDEDPSLKTRVNALKDIELFRSSLIERSSLSILQDSSVRYSTLPQLILLNDIDTQTPVGSRYMKSVYDILSVRRKRLNCYINGECMSHNLESWYVCRPLHINEDLCNKIVMNEIAYQYDSLSLNYKLLLSQLNDAWFAEEL